MSWRQTGETQVRQTSVGAGLGGAGRVWVLNECVKGYLVYNVIYASAVRVRVRVRINNGMQMTEEAEVSVRIRPRPVLMSVL